VKPIFFFGFFLFILSASLCAQNTDTAIVTRDSLIALNPPDSTLPVKAADTIKQVIVQKDTFLLKNKLLNSGAEPVSLAVQVKKVKRGDTFFYLIAGIVLLLAFLKYFYSQYFTNLFRVFFNPTLRQTKIPDQLLQTKLQPFLSNWFV